MHNSSKKTDNLNYNHTHLKTSGIILNTSNTNLTSTETGVLQKWLNFATIQYNSLYWKIAHWTTFVLSKIKAAGTLFIICPMIQKKRKYQRIKVRQSAFIWLTTKLWNCFYTDKTNSRSREISISTIKLGKC